MRGPDASTRRHQKGVDGIRTRRARHLALLLPLALTAGLTLAGCGQEESEQTVVGGAPPPSTSFDRRAREIVRAWPEVAPVSGVRGEMLPLQGADRPKDPSSARELTVTVGHGACDARYGARVYESGRTVVVAGWSVERDPNGACTDQLLLDKVKVPLETELGGRRVVDAVSAKPLLAK